MAAKTYKCPNCDAGLIFDPKTQKFTCEYCLSSYTESELENIDQDMEESRIPNPGEQEKGEKRQRESSTSDRAEENSHMAVFTCPSCGGEIIADETTAATFCYYCHNPVVLSQRLDGAYTPDKVVPFTIERKQAIEGLMDWIGRKKFIPRDFYDKKQVEKITGVYFPCWVMDCDMEASMEGDATKVRMWRSGDTEYRETSFYHVRRGGVAHFREIMRNALRKERNKFWENVQPFDLRGAKAFNEGYLLGFQAEKRKVEKEELVPEIERQMRQKAEGMMRETTAGYQAMKVRSGNYIVRDARWNYVLLPVWILTYRTRSGKEYYYAMNGQSGTVYGELPVDYRKLGILSSCIGAAVFLLAALI